MNALKRGVAAASVLAHRLDTQDELDRTKHARRRVERVIDERPFCERTGHEQHRSVRIHVVWAALRIVFHHENGRVLPVRAVRHGFDDAAEAEVVVGDHHPGRGRAGDRALRVVVRQMDDRQLRQIPVAFEITELGEPVVHSLGVGDVQIEARVRRSREALEPGNVPHRDDIARTTFSTRCRRTRRSCAH